MASEHYCIRTLDLICKLHNVHLTADISEKMHKNISKLLHNLFTS